MSSKTDNLKTGTPLADGRTAPADEKAVSIMVVDDEQFVIDVICEHLENCGYTVSCANSGEDAVRQFESQVTDLAIVDYMMGGIDGLETIEKLTAISPSCVTVLMTGFPTLDSSIKALRLGAADYILKPFKLDEVSVAVEKAVKEWKFKKEMNRLRDRVSELEASVSEKKDSIKIHKKIDVVSGKSGYSTKYKPSDKKRKPEKE